MSTPSNKVGVPASLILEVGSWDFSGVRSRPPAAKVYNVTVHAKPNSTLNSMSPSKYFPSVFNGPNNYVLRFRIVVV